MPWPSYWPVVKWRRGRGKARFVFENPTISKWLPLVWSIHLRVFRSLAAGSMSWRKEPCHHSSILCTQPGHAEYQLLSLLAFLLLLLFLGFIIHVSDFRCMWSRVLEIWDNFKITDAQSWLFEPTSATGLGDYQRSCSGWLIFARTSLFPTEIKMPVIYRGFSFQ